MNKILLCGRLTRDPETRTTGTTTVARYTLAVDRRFKQDGQPDADFFNCTAFGKAAEFAEKFLKQGTKIIVSGRIQSDNYTNKNGEKVYSWQVIAEEQEFAESKASKTAETPAAAEPTATTGAFVDIADGIEEELPFL